MALEESREGQGAILWFTPELTDWIPSNIKAKSSKKRIFISWDQPLVNGILHQDIIGYRIYHSMDDITFHPIGTLSKNFPRAFTFVTDMDVGTHYFKVSTLFKHQYETELSPGVSVVHGEGYGG